MNEYQQLKTMLERSGTGFGLGPGNSIQVEGDAGESQWGISNFEFDEQGQLINVSIVQGEEG